VPNNQRVLRGDQVTEKEIDDPLFSSTNMEDRPALKKEYRDGQRTLLSPQATKALRLRAQMMEDPPVKKCVEEKMADGEEGLHMFQAMQEEAQCLSLKEARGAEVLRHLSISKLQGYLTRKHEGDSGSGDAWHRSPKPVSLRPKRPIRSSKSKGDTKATCFAQRSMTETISGLLKCKKFWNRTL